MLRMRYLLVDGGSFDEQELAQVRNLTAAIMDLEKSKGNG